MYRGVQQIPESPEIRQRKWDVANEKERREYHSAMVQWVKDFPKVAEIMRDVIHPSAFKEASRGGVNGN